MACGFLPPTAATKAVAAAAVHAVDSFSPEYEIENMSELSVRVVLFVCCAVLCCVWRTRPAVDLRPQLVDFNWFLIIQCARPSERLGRDRAGATRRVCNTNQCMRMCVHETA